MVERLRKVHPFHALFAWFSHGHRLIALIVITALMAASGLVYGVVNDRSQSAADKKAAADRAAFYACVPKYVGDLSRTNLPRTIASIEASNARFNWDVGFDKHHPTWGKARLKAEYVRLYHKYQRVVVTNPPLPAFSAKYCKVTEGNAPQTPVPSSTPTKSTRHLPSAPGHATSSPTGSGSQPSRTPSDHRYVGGHGTSSSSTPPTPRPTLPGLLLPDPQSLICNMLPVVCGGLKLPVLPIG